MKKAILGLTFGIMSVFGATSMAYANTSYTSQNTSYDESVQETKSSNAPSAYEKYGFGEVKADGQWVNDNHN